jgi:hypothetical protein
MKDCLRAAEEGSTSGILYVERPASLRSHIIEPPFRAFLEFIGACSDTYVDSADAFVMKKLEGVTAQVETVFEQQRVRTAINIHNGAGVRKSARSDGKRREDPAFHSTLVVIDA